MNNIFEIRKTDENYVLPVGLASVWTQWLLPANSNNNNNFRNVNYGNLNNNNANNSNNGLAPDSWIMCRTS